MWKYEPLKKNFYGLAVNAQTNLSSAHHKKHNEPHGFNLHDIDLARLDIYTFLGTSDFSTKDNFINQLKAMAENDKVNAEAVSEQKYREARKNILSRLIEENS